MNYEVQPELSPAPQLQVYGDAREQTSELDQHHDDGAYDVVDQPFVDEDEYPDQATRVRRPKLVVAMAMFSLALAGTTAAFGYRAMISGALLPAVPPIIKATDQPIKIAPASNEPHAKNAANASQVDTVTTGSIEKLVSREEQPVTIVPPKPTSRVISTIPITTRQDLLTRAGGYAVQVTSERSESRAQAAFRALQAKYPIQLSGRHPIIRRADLGAAGTYYRALVGPLRSAEEAKRLCSGLKAAGADCIIQKN